eukprot:CAMPEP_0118717484 /NCGR_PEP_ID=MMETSP0800-20121206/28189_1 /TAXON_ID=210618 ORGANISM="Striatella unipunctata, Strain CCMP2910" /NCGR_SAMPLE_ID=MMETSP0800 /ASSEMBLY_ACC=CAM_ASM_000638 /LENGTH=514 /DNA_ID=CAMNT_0006624235 /DNA_START=232 /DNA_END=1773 /DNA_ORIENTATION=+
MYNTKKKWMFGTTTTQACCCIRVLTLLLLAWKNQHCALAFNLTEDILTKSYEAAVLGVGLTTIRGDIDLRNKALGPWGFEEPVVAYTDEPDRAMVARKANQCFAVFRGSILSRADWAQNLNRQFVNNAFCGSSLAVTEEEFATANSTNSTNSSTSTTMTEEVCCSSRAGFTEAYFNTTFYNNMTAEIENCVNDACSEEDIKNGDCLVMAGHSQGGAIALLASLDFARYNPVLVTWGQPPAIDDPCPLLVRNQHDGNNDDDDNNNIINNNYYRYINTLSDDSFGLLYDPVPFTSDFGADHFGHEIVLGDDTENVAYFGNNHGEELLSPQPALHQQGWFYFDVLEGSLPVHGMVEYRDRLHALLMTAASSSSLLNTTTTTATIGTDGWNSSFFCIDGSECKSNKCSRLGGGLSLVQICTGNEGDLCDSHDDCFSDLCVDHKCRVPGPEIGDYCKSDDACNSGICLASTTSTCAAPGGSCEPCARDEECLSGFCPHGACGSVDQVDGKVENGCSCFW